MQSQPSQQGFVERAVDRFGWPTRFFGLHLAQAALNACSRRWRSRMPPKPSPLRSSIMNRSSNASSGRGCRPARSWSGNYLERREASAAATSWAAPLRSSSQRFSVPIECRCIPPVDEFTAAAESRCRARPRSALRPHEHVLKASEGKRVAIVQRGQTQSIGKRAHMHQRDWS